MDAENIEKIVKRAKDDIMKEVSDRLPRKVGVVAVNHFKQNFRDGGWLDNGLHPWKRTRRQDSSSADADYGPLTSRRNHKKAFRKGACQCTLCHRRAFHI